MLDWIGQVKAQNPFQQMSRQSSGRHAQILPESY